MFPQQSMDWSRFDARGEDKDEAFEAFAGQLFERWCRRELAHDLQDVCFVYGKGGDGGVEAYALLGSGDVVGLQAKWFRGSFGDAQIQQLERSLQQAIAVRPRLVRYCVALRCGLSDERGGREKTARARWRDWVAKASKTAPGVAIELWDEARLEALLHEPENEGLHAYWFTGAVITLDDLKLRFDTARRSWLHERYLPDLHAIGALEEDLACRLGEPKERAKLLVEVRACIQELGTLRDDVVRLDRISAFRRDVPDAAALRRSTLDALERLLSAGSALEQSLQRSVSPSRGSEPSDHEEAPLRQLAGALQALESGIYDPTSRIRERLSCCALEGLPTLRRAWARWHAAQRLGAYVGAPGVGKTHGLAHAVEQRLARGLPAAILRAKDCPVEGGWGEILRKAFDRPTSGLPEILNAMEAAAVRADVLRARRGEQPAHAPGAAGQVQPERVSFLMAIDGLEEAGKHRCWAELLGDLSGHLERHPRLRAAVTLRTASREPILGAVRVDLFDEVKLPEGGEVQTLLPAYCDKRRVKRPDRRVRWAIREPLSLRLYCELQRGAPAGWATQPWEVSLTALLREKLRRVAEELRQRRGWSRPVPLLQALTAIADARIGTGSSNALLRRDEAAVLIRGAASPGHELSVNDAYWLLDQAAEHGLLIESTIESAGDLVQPVRHVELAGEPLIDYLIAHRASDALRAGLDRGDLPPLPDALRTRPDALAQTVILLAQQGISLIASRLWHDQLRSDAIERLELAAIATLDHDAARARKGWVLERLRASMPSCRRVLAELCIPVARDVAHPFGPRFVHEALLSLAPAKRDRFWSGPRVLPGDGGQAWEGTGVPALEELRLEDDDPADGPPLLLAWALTSVVTDWRRRLRAELSRWGASDLGELVRWLDLAIQTNDPQMAEDVALVAFGAACLAGADPKLAQLVAWVDAHLLAPDAPDRREDVHVIHAARGVVERARVVGIDVDPAIVEHARALYVPAGRTLPFDAAAAPEGSDENGEGPFTGRFVWYLLPPTLDPFFGYAGNLHRWTPERAQRLDPRTDRILCDHAEQAGLVGLSPLRLAFGVLMAYLRQAGWSEDEFYGDSIDRSARTIIGMDVAIARYHGDGWTARGNVSRVCTVAEKYIRTGCHRLLAYLAARAPIHADGPERAEPPVDPLWIDLPEVNPAFDAIAAFGKDEVPWVFWPDDGLVSPIVLHAEDQAERAIEWVMTAPPPELSSWLRLPRSATQPLGEGDEEWITLSGFVRAREHDSQADSNLWIGSAVVDKHDTALLEDHAASHPSSGLLQVCESGESTGARGDPAEALWAPWAVGRDGTRVVSAQGRQGNTDIQLVSTFAEAFYDVQRGSGIEYRLPAFWLRKRLDLIDVEVSGGGKNLRFVDRGGQVQAVYTDHHAGDLQWQKSLVIRRSALERALHGRDQKLIWSVHLLREPNPSLINYLSRNARSALRDWHWLAIMTDRGTKIVPLLPGFGDVRGTAEYQSPVTASPALAGHPETVSGPGTPELATPLSTDLADDQAIPYFLWDDPIPVGEVRRRLATASQPEREQLLGKILREAKDPDVWRFTTPQEVAAQFSRLARYLGRRRRFWEFLLKLWYKEGLLEHEPA